MEVTVKVQAKVLHLHIHVRDALSIILYAQNHQVLADCKGFVPTFLQSNGESNYLSLQIDVDTGMLVNQRLPTAEELEAFISENPPC